MLRYILPKHTKLGSVLNIADIIIIVSCYTLFSLPIHYILEKYYLIHMSFPGLVFIWIIFSITCHFISDNFIQFQNMKYGIGLTLKLIEKLSVIIIYIPKFPFHKKCNNYVRLFCVNSMIPPKYRLSFVKGTDISQYDGYLVKNKVLGDSFIKSPEQFFSHAGFFTYSKHKYPFKESSYQWSNDLFEHERLDKLIEFMQEDYIHRNPAQAILEEMRESRKIVR